MSRYFSDLNSVFMWSKIKAILRKLKVGAGIVLCRFGQGVK